MINLYYHFNFVGFSLQYFFISSFGFMCSMAIYTWCKIRWVKIFWFTLSDMKYLYSFLNHSNPKVLHVNYFSITTFDSERYSRNLCIFSYTIPFVIALVTIIVELVAPQDAKYRPHFEFNIFFGGKWRF